MVRIKMNLSTKNKIKIAYTIKTLIIYIFKFLNVPNILCISRNGIKWEINLNEGIDFSIWLLGNFEPRTIAKYRKILKFDDIVLDVGANIGAHTLPFAQLVGPKGRVIAFEPTLFAITKLKKNLSINPDLKSRVLELQVMLTSASSVNFPTRQLYSSWPLDGKKNKHKIHQGQLMGTTGATVRTLDDIVLDLKLDKINLIKIDIDGYEYQMLSGGLKTIEKFKPSILLELAPYALEEQGSSLTEVLNLLKEIDYKIYPFDSDKTKSISENQILKLIPAGGSINVFAEFCK